MRQCRGPSSHRLMISDLTQLLLHLGQLRGLCGQEGHEFVSLALGDRRLSVGGLAGCPSCIAIR